MKSKAVAILCLVALIGCSSRESLNGAHFFEESFWCEDAEYKCVMVSALVDEARVLRQAVMVIPRADLAPDDYVTGWAFADKMLLGYRNGSTIKTIEADPETVYLIRKRESGMGNFENIVEMRKTFAELGIDKKKHILHDIVPILEKLIRENLPKDE